MSSSRVNTTTDFDETEMHLTQMIQLRTLMSMSEFMKLGLYERYLLLLYKYI